MLPRRECRDSVFKSSKFSIVPATPEFYVKSPDIWTVAVNVIQPFPKHWATTVCTHCRLSVADRLLGTDSGLPGESDVVTDWEWPWQRIDSHFWLCCHESKHEGIDEKTDNKQVSSFLTLFLLSWLLQTFSTRLIKLKGKQNKIIGLWNKIQFSEFLCFIVPWICSINNLIINLFYIVRAIVHLLLKNKCFRTIKSFKYIKS